MAGHNQRDWRELCAAVTNEPDSKKLDSLVQELIRALDEGEREWRFSICSPDAIGTKREAPRWRVTKPAEPRLAAWN
jgi:hypothetical protein